MPKRTPAAPDLAERFTPRFWQQTDQRTATARVMRERYEALKADAGADSVQRDMLVQRAVFIGLQLETMEVRAAEEGVLDMGVYTQAVNALSGLLSKLGLNAHKQKTPSLQTYLSGRGDAA